MSLLGKLHASYEALMETAFPSHCASCGDAIEDSDFPSLCRRCSRRLQLIDSPKCQTCGYPFFGEAQSRENCMHCDHLRPAFGRGWSVALLRGPVRELIHALKYEQGFWALRDLSELLRRSKDLDRFVEGAIFVPVPLHPRKLRERGYNQSDLIIEELMRCFPQCSGLDAIERVLDTESQTQFSRQERIRNLKNAFSLKSNRAIERSKRYIIVDDVFTTGSTLNACAAALRKAGARRVDTLAIGHG